jgi:hypothetical protein
MNRLKPFFTCLVNGEKKLQTNIVIGIYQISGIALLISYFDARHDNAGFLTRTLSIKLSDNILQ